VKRIICDKSGHEIDWDGRVVWVNDSKTGSSIGRFSKTHAEVHLDLEQQVQKGTSCLDCFDDTTINGWKRFQASMLEHYGAVVPDEARPNYLRS
jgi:hypothetical protein